MDHVQIFASCLLLATLQQRSQNYVQKFWCAIRAVRAVILNMVPVSASFYKNLGPTL